MKFLIILGTSRKNNQSQYVAKFIERQINLNPKLEVEIISSQTLGINFDNEGQTACSEQFSTKVDQADGYIIVTPEYNHGYPATLKYILDLNLEEYLHKPMAFVSVSSGSFGGNRVIENLLPVIRTLGLVAIYKDLYFPKVNEEIKDGQLVDPEKWEKPAKKMIEELVWMAKALKKARAK